MSISLKTHAFAGNPLKPKTPKTLDPLSPSQALETLKTRLLEPAAAGGHVAGSGSPEFRVLPFRKGKPLATGSGGAWRLGWIGLDRFRDNCGTGLTGELLVYLGSESGGGPRVVYWAADVSEEGEFGGGGGGTGLRMSFVVLRTLMVAADWDNETAMGQLAITDHVRA